MFNYFMLHYVNRDVARYIVKLLDIVALFAIATFALFFGIGLGHVM